MMMGFAAIFSGFSSWLSAYLGAEWTFRIAVVATVVGVYATIWAAVGAGLSGIAAMIPSSPFTGQMAMFFPASGAVSTAVAAYWGSLASKKALDFWRSATLAASRS